MNRIASSIAVLIVTGVIVAAGLALSGDREQPATQGVVPAVVDDAAQPSESETTEHAAVDLDESFHIPMVEGADLSHTPFVRFTSDGKRFVVATADSELVVFDALTRELQARHRPFETRATSAVSIDTSGRRAAWVLEGGGVAVVDVSSGKVKVSDPEAGATWVAMAPDGKSLAISRGDTVEIRRVKDLAVVHTDTAQEGEITNLAWSRNGRLVGSTSKSGRVVLFESATGETVLTVNKAEPMFAIDFHPSGDYVAFGGQDRTVYQRAIASGDEKVLSGNQPYWITSVGYSPDGRMIAVGDESCDVWLYDTDRPEAVFHSKHHVECWLANVAWLPDGKTFLFACRPNSHAGKPALYSPLNRVEAARSQKVRDSRGQLKASIDAELSDNPDEEVRSALEQLKAQLDSEEKLEGQGVALQAQVEINQQQLLQTAAPQAIDLANGNRLPSGAFDTSVLPDSIQQRLREHQKTQGEVEQELQSKFVINQWKVKR